MINTQTTISPITTPCIALVGPTGIGKTSLSLLLADRLNCEIVSVDSMQVYRYMDIGTAKIRADEMEGIPHHLIDIVTPDEDYDAARFVADATAAIKGIEERGRVPLLTGGTGLYLKALTEGLFAELPSDEVVRESLKKRLIDEDISKLHEELSECDPLSAKRIHPHDTSRILRGLEIFLTSGKPWSQHLAEQQDESGPVKNILQIGLTCEREVLYERINRRAQLMVEEGIVDEVRGLLAMGYGRELKSMNSIGYRHVATYLAGEWDFEQMLNILKRDTRRYAKRQYTWFRGIDSIEWFEVTATDAICRRVEEWWEKAAGAAESF